jgi:hypothetical protein
MRPLVEKNRKKAWARSQKVLDFVGIPLGQSFFNRLEAPACVHMASFEAQLRMDCNSGISPDI